MKQRSKEITAMEVKAKIVFVLINTGDSVAMGATRGDKKCFSTRQP
jgi:hypothetical protein